MSSAQTSPEERAAALAVYREHGLAEAVRRSGVPKTTLRRWAIAEGMDPSALAGANVERTEAARLARESRIEELRSEVREGLLLAAADMLERLHEPHIDYRGRDSAKVTFDRAPADACRNYSVAAAVFIDKFRLESGESTDRRESLTGDLLESKSRVARMRDELTVRRESKAS